MGPDDSRLDHYGGPRPLRTDVGGIECATVAVFGQESYDRFWTKLMPPGVGYFGVDLSPVDDDVLASRVGRFKQCQVEIIDDCGHMVHYEQPQKLLEILRNFL